MTVVRTRQVAGVKPAAETAGEHMHRCLTAWIALTKMRKRHMAGVQSAVSHTTHSYSLARQMHTMYIMGGGLAGGRTVPLELAIKLLQACSARRTLLRWLPQGRLDTAYSTTAALMNLAIQPQCGW
jgi:hypothetical protein